MTSFLLTEPNLPPRSQCPAIYQLKGLNLSGVTLTNFSAKPRQVLLETVAGTLEELDLNVIIRPGPYICAEWEFGGLPSWLLKYPNIALRCDDPLYMEKVTPFYKELFDRVRPHLCTNGGKVFMVQVENEYGSFGHDTQYLQYTQNSL